MTDKVDNVEQKKNQEINAELEKNGFVDIKNKEIDEIQNTDVNTEIQADINDYEKLKQDYAELKDILNRTVADTENFKKRKERELFELRKFALENIMIELLPPLDNFKRAFTSAENVDTLEKAKQTIDGFKLIEQELEKILIKFGLKQIESVNMDFDPSIHQAIQCVDVEEEEKDNKVLEEYQSGYKLNDKVIRSAMVKVGKKK